MIKKLTKSGNSYAIVIDRAILDLLKITPETPLEVTTNGHGLIVQPVGREIAESEIDEAFSWADKKYGRMLRRLAE